MPSSIALIAPTYLPSRRANTFQVMKMAAALSETGNLVRMIVPLPGGTHPGAPHSWSDLAVHYGLATEFEIEWISSSGAWRGYDFGLRAAARAREWGAGLVYTRHPQAAAAAGLRGLPTILEVHDFPNGRMAKRLLRLFLQSRGARRLVAVSDALLRDLQRVFPLPPAPFAVVERDGVDLERFTDLPSPEAARATLGLPDRFTAGYTGHLYAGRGIDTILGMAARLPAVHFLLAGGRDADVERVRGESAGLDNVTLAGFIPNTALPTYQAACEVLLMPYGEKISASSGGDIAPYLSPMKLFEYLASGRAVLSSDLPVLREVLDESNAVLLPPGDIEAWADAVGALESDPARRKRLGEAGRSAASRYSWRARAERILAGLG
jgi:glycosyltransferase involved in cell wall biosynthesis